MQSQEPKFSLRPFRDGDEDSLVRYADNRNIWINLRDHFPNPYTMDDAKWWINRVKDASPVLSFAIASESDEVIGGIGLVLGEANARKSAEVGYWLGEPFWGHGIMTVALGMLVDYAFENFDLVRLSAYVLEYNPGSARVLEKAGFTREGVLRKACIKDGKVVDEFLYALVREE